MHLPKNLTKPQRVLYFDGSDDYINVGSYETLDDLPLGDFTITAWIKDEHTAVITWGGIVCNYRHTPFRGWNFRTFSDGSGNRSVHFQVIFSAGHLNYNTTYGSVTNEWTHVEAVFFSATKSAKIYINGVEVSSYQQSTNGVGSYPENSMINLGTLAPGNQAFKGNIDDVRIFNKALDADERTKVYKGQAVTDGLVAWYKFNEKSGATAIDSSGNNNNGTIVGATREKLRRRR